VKQTPSKHPHADESCSVPDHQHLTERVVELENRATVDALTGLGNRAHFDNIIGKERSRSLRYKQPLSMILFDIDHFKRINDTLGHQAGDAVLRELAQVCQNSLRPSDITFRWGGEEFIVLAPSTGYRGADRLAETLRQAVAGHVFPEAGKVTISLGVAEHQSEETIAAWFERADKMLYAAKEEGRNCVRVDTNGNSDVWAGAEGLAALNLVWQEAYECGEPSIDEEHRELFRLANVLIHTHTSASSGRDTVIQAYDELLEHIRVHFRHEEELLTRHGYPKAEAHKRIHDNLLTRAQELRNVMLTGGAGLGGIIEFLAVDVVARHLFKADRDFFPLFTKR